MIPISRTDLFLLIAGKHLLIALAIVFVVYLLSFLDKKDQWLHVQIGAALTSLYLVVAFAVEWISYL